jgi:hypothetical protein
MSISIDEKNNAVKIILSNTLYPFDAVKKAAEDFRDIGDFTISKKNVTSIVIKLKDKDYISSIGYEFCNYVLALMKNEAFI